MSYLANAVVQWSCTAATHRSGPGKNVAVWCTIAKSNIQNAMKIKLAMVAAVLASTGCAVKTAPPIDVRLVPNDCANRQMIINYLETQAQQPRAVFESESTYERSRSEIRHRIWTVRYHCQPV